MLQRGGFTPRILVLCVAFLLALAPDPVPASQSGGALSKAAADSCDAKIQALEDNAPAPGKTAKPRTTRLSEVEMNSYLAYILKPHFHPSLKSLEIRFEEGHLQGTAQVDFDKLQFKSTQFLSGIIRAMLSGVHTMTVRGVLIAQEGKANFQLEEARFDTLVLPNFLVSEIITTIGRRQDPPFDPMQPSTMPYGIKKAEVHAGYILLYQ